MLTQPAKIFLPITALGTVAAIAYAIMTNDHGSIALFVALPAVALYLAIAVTISRDNEAAPVLAADAEPPRLRAAEPATLPGGGGWPFVAAIGLGLLALSLVAGPVLAVGGVALLAVAAIAWLAGASADNTGRVPNLVPIGIPVVGIFTIASIVFFMSRILLAVPEQASTFIAVVVAVLIFGLASFVALKPAISSRALIVGLLVGGILMGGGGLVAAAFGTREIEKHSGHAEGIHVVAENIAFNVEEIDLHAGQEAAIDFENKEKIPHNVAIYPNEEGRNAIFQGEVVIGPITAEYRFPAPAVGTYFFRCDIHPNMKGKVVVA